MGRMTKGFLFFGKAARKRQSLFSNVENCAMMRATNFKIRKQRTFSRGTMPMDVQ